MRNRKHFYILSFALLVQLILLQSLGRAEKHSDQLPIQVQKFEQQKHTGYRSAGNLVFKNIRSISYSREGAIVVKTPEGRAQYTSGKWQATLLEPKGLVDSEPQENILHKYPTLSRYLKTKESIRQVRRYQGEIVVAAEEGLFVGDGNSWTMALPRQGDIRWAPIDIRAVVYDADGRLWFACPQGVGYRVAENQWKLFTGTEGLPFNDFTCMAAGPKGVWFGTTNGAIRYHQGDWEFRQGRRWLLDNHVIDIAIDNSGNAWLATQRGVSCIEFQPMTLRQKADYFEKEIGLYHRRTRFGYVNTSVMSSPGDKETAVPQFSDNDGHFTGLYLAAVSLGYSVTQKEKLRNDAKQAFEAIAFLSEVTQGGPHPAPKGFIARNVIPITDPNPNPQFDLNYDIRRNKADKLWKIIQPRLPIDETGEWYWKCDSSSDELDGHYLGYGTYFDYICKTEEEKDRVREVVRRVTDHLLDHNFTQVDYDGLPTRWGHFSPEDLNQNEQWWQERGLNSLSILTYLAVAHHITGDQVYRDAYLKLANDHGYAMNGMTQAKHESGPGSFGQGDDAMAFMNYYNLLRYETDPRLLNMYRFAVYRHWQIEKYERNPFFNFVYAACNLGKTFEDHWGSLDLLPTQSWLEDSIDTLKRYPLDRIDWPMSNAHRIDMLPLPDHVREPGQNVGFGYRVDGRPFRIDEQYLPIWGSDPWKLSNNSDGRTLSDGVSFLLAYYMGLAHGYITD